MTQASIPQRRIGHFLAGVLAAAVLPVQAFSAEPSSAVSSAVASSAAIISNRAMGFTLADRRQLINVVPDPEGAKVECPQGLNDGPRKSFLKMYPDESKRSVMDVLQWEADVWFPSPDFDKEPVKFKEPVGTVAAGMNLDGKVDPNDYTSPSGEKGIDNQLYRAIGCINFFRKPEGVDYYVVPLTLLPTHFNRVIVEVTELDDIKNDDSVTVTFYRGLGGIFRDAQGNPAPRGTSRISERWGKRFVYALTGKIVDGVLTTEPAELNFPYSQDHGEFTATSIRDARLKLQITTEGAVGMLAGYVNVNHTHFTYHKSWDTAHTAYGQVYSMAYYNALSRNADAYPDANGRNTAISAAWEIKLVQSFILRSPKGKATAQADGRDVRAEAGRR